jgi:hypothetical protein
MKRQLSYATTVIRVHLQLLFSKIQQTLQTIAMKPCAAIIAVAAALGTRFREKNERANIAPPTSNEVHRCRQSIPLVMN